MIGDFRFLEQPGPGGVTLELLFSETGERLGKLSYCDDVAALLRAVGFAATRETLPLASALPYAIAAAIHANTELTLTGDPSVWNPRWGKLRVKGALRSAE